MLGKAVIESTLWRVVLAVDIGKLGTPMRSFEAACQQLGAYMLGGSCCWENQPENHVWCHYGLVGGRENKGLVGPLYELMT